MIMSFVDQKLGKEQQQQQKIEKWKTVPVEDRLIHVHIPKTGGSWLNRVLHDSGVKIYDHASVQYCFEAMSHEPIWIKTDQMEVNVQLAHIEEPVRAGTWDRGCKVSIVRNPFDWLVSYYTHRGHGDHAHHRGWDNICSAHNIDSFDMFVRQYCDPQQRWWHQWYKRSPFYQMMSSGDGLVSIGVDYVLKQEKLGDGTEELLKLLAIKPADWKTPFQWRSRVNSNMTRKLDYREYYTPELREIAEAHFEQELSLFDYSFDGPTSDWSLLDMSKNSDKKFSWTLANNHTRWT